VTILGEVPAGTALTRSGARVGDDIYVSGTLGDAALAVAALTGRTVLGEEALAAARARLERPVPRIALGAALRGVATAAIDVSDGLVGDLGHVLERSLVGATVDLAAVPRCPALARMLTGAERAQALECLLAGGDDYELCFTAPADAAARIAAIAAQVALPLTRVGVITEPEQGLIVRDEKGVPLAALPRAFDHFAQGDA
jgi:thiamine-monophosphate kinase